MDGPKNFFSVRTCIKPNLVLPHFQGVGAGMGGSVSGHKQGRNIGSYVQGNVLTHIHYSDQIRRYAH